MQAKIQGPSTAILFGSRARSTSSYLSDFDVVLIINSSEKDSDFRTWALDYSVDLFVFDSSLLEAELDQCNTILLDAILEGEVLFDEMCVVKNLRKYANQFIHGRGITKTKDGWIPSPH